MYISFQSEVGEVGMFSPTSERKLRQGALPHSKWLRICVLAFNSVLLMLRAFPKAGFIAQSCAPSCIAFVKLANTDECFVRAKCWGDWLLRSGGWVPSLSGLFPCPTPWALLLSFCCLSQAVCFTLPSPQLPDTSGRVHYSMY